MLKSSEEKYTRLYNTNDTTENMQSTLNYWRRAEKKNTQQTRSEINVETNSKRRKQLGIFRAYLIRSERMKVMKSVLHYSEYLLFEFRALIALPTTTRKCVWVRLSERVSVRVCMHGVHTVCLCAPACMCAFVWACIREWVKWVCYMFQRCSKSYTVWFGVVAMTIAVVQ